MSDSIRVRDVIIGFTVTAAAIVIGLGIWLTPDTPPVEPEPEVTDPAES